MKFHYYGDLSIAKSYKVVVASEYDQKSNTMRLGVAFVNKSDKFLKNIGRNLAIDRLQTKPYIFNPIGPFDFNSLKPQITGFLTACVSGPSWFKRFMSAV
jgi:hypothetical protein